MNKKSSLWVCELKNALGFWVPDLSSVHTTRRLARYSNQSFVLCNPDYKRFVRVSKYTREEK